MRVGEALAHVALGVVAFYCSAVLLAGHVGLQALMAGAGVSLMAIGIKRVVELG